MNTATSNQRSDLYIRVAERVVADLDRGASRLRYEATMKESDRNDPRGNNVAI